MEQPVRVVHDGRGASPPPPKSVAFELVFPESPQYRARLPMRVQIYLHDTTDSIVTTVKNFYGLYSGPNGSPGISFEDEQGNTLIARYENFRDNMTVYVRVTGENGAPTGAFGANQYPVAVGAQSFYTDDTSNHLLAPHQADGHHISRPTSRTSRNRSLSPGGRGRRSASAGTNPNSRSRSVKKRGPGSLNNGDNQSDAMNGYSSGDNAPGSASHLGNTEISVENIVEGGRRKRAKFESSVCLICRYIIENVPFC